MLWKEVVVHSEITEIIYTRIPPRFSVEERNSRHGSGGLSPERGGILGSVI